MQATCSYDVDIADSCCQLEPISKIAIPWLWDHKPSREILQLHLSALKPTTVSRGQKTVHDTPTRTNMGFSTPFTTSTSYVNALQALTIHSQLNCGQKNCRDLICHTSVGSLRLPFAKLLTDVVGVYGEAIIFHNRPAQSSPAELAPVFFFTHTHTR